jgi:ADP-heptose:LPS heptosyltransferase
MCLTEKRWPAERYAALADRLRAEHGARVVLLGGPGDRTVVDAVRSTAAAPPDDLSGARPLAEVAAIIEACDLYVGNDSGIAHLAAAVGTPVVAVFGPTDPRRYGPVPGAGVAVAPPGGGAVERLAAATGSRAIEGVTVDAVWAAVGQVDDRSRRQRPDRDPPSIG